MAQPIKGTEGLITANGFPTGFISTWNAEFDSNEQTTGPFIGDPNIYTYSTATRLTGSLEGVVPVGKDPGQTAILSGALSRMPVNLELVITGGYTVTIPSANISTFSMSPNAEETVSITLEFSSNGGYSFV